MRLWFDVGIKRYTTDVIRNCVLKLLWFDVGIKRYTTRLDIINQFYDVGIKRYTTRQGTIADRNCCGLMQESKDIQHVIKLAYKKMGCGLMQESKDIQQQNDLTG